MWFFPLRMSSKDRISHTYSITNEAFSHFFMISYTLVCNDLSHMGDKGGKGGYFPELTAVHLSFWLADTEKNAIIHRHFIFFNFF